MNRWLRSLRTVLPSRMRRTSPRDRAWRKLLLEPLEDRRLLSGTQWTQRGGDAGHTSYVDLAVDANAITQAWNQPINYAASGYWAQNGNRGVAIDGTSVYRTELDGYWASGNYHVMAFDLQSGAPIWNKIIVGNGPVSAPTVVNGYVYINRSGHSGISGGTDNDKPWLYELYASTGNTITRTSYSAQWESDERPTVAGTQLVSYNGYYGGMGSWTAPGLTAQWARSGSIYETPNAVMDATYVYAYGNPNYDNGTHVYLRSNGSDLGVITHPSGLIAFSPVVSASGKLLLNLSGSVNGVQKYGVAAYDAATRNLLWTYYTPTSVAGKAVGNGVVAVTSGTQLILLDEATGTALRSWQAPSNLTEQIVLTRTHAFVEAVGYPYGPYTAYAVNLSTMQSEWSYTNNTSDENGSTFMELAAAGGKLILSHDGFVKAFNIPPRANRPPDAVDDAATTAEDTGVTVNVLANDTDADGDALTISAVGKPGHGTARANADGTITYTPTANYNGSDSFTYTVSDGYGGSDTAAVTVTVTPVPDPPIANGWQYSVNEDTILFDHLHASDPDGDPITFAVVSPPAHGTLQVTRYSGEFNYTPAPNWNGTDVFSFKVNDGTYDSNVAQVYIAVRPVNDAPVAQNDAYTTNEDTALTVSTAQGVLANDSDVDGDRLTAVLVAGPSKGNLALNADGSFTYTPYADANGTDTFTYKASDGALYSNVATVTLTVNPVDDAPVAFNDSYTLDEDTTLGADASAGVLANDRDVEGDRLTAALVSGPSKGTLTLNADGSFTYTPFPNANGLDQFTYKANDGTLDSNLAGVVLTINPVNDAPEARDDGYSTDEDTPLVVGTGTGLLANDTDVDGDRLSARLVSAPAKGTLALNADGSFTYTPYANVNGTDSFSYKANDGALDSNIATVALTVNPVEDPPVAVAGPDQTANEAAVVTFDGSASYDVDGDNLTYTWSFGDGGSAGGPAPTHVYADNGSYTVTLTVDDGHGGTSSDQLVVTVNDVAPNAALSGPGTGVRGQTRTFTFTAADVSAVDQASGFTYTINWGDGTAPQSAQGASGVAVDHIFTAAGSFTVVVTATDKDGGTSPAAAQAITVRVAEMQGNTLVVGGTTGADTIQVKAEVSGAVSVTVNGAAQGTFQPTDRIVVYAQAGDDTVQVQSTKIKGTTYYVTVTALLYGGAGADTVDARGSTAGNVLEGGDGADTLLGGGGRDLLVGGLGADQLHGGGDDDILIGGTTDFDADPAALAAVLTEWARADLGYQARLDHLTGAAAGGLNGTYLLTTGTVHDDAAVDQLWGDAGQDWLSYQATGPFADVLNDRKRNEQATPL